MHQQTGFLSEEELNEIFPSQERLEEGPVAIIECVQLIPCNPCQDACPRSAILPFEKMTDSPVIDHAKCNGCSICMAYCPGLAIYILDYPYSDMTSLIKIPYEMLPLPLKEDEVDLYDRSGKKIGKGKVIRVQSFKQNPKTHIVWVEIPKDLYKTARNIKVAKHDR